MKLSKEQVVEDIPKVVVKKSKRPVKKISPILASVLAGVVVGVLIGLIVSYFIYDAQVVKVRQAQLQEYSKQKSALTAARVGSYLNSLNERVAFFADQTLLRNAVLAGEVQTITDTKRSITRQIDNVLAVNVYTKEQAALNKEAFPPVTFAVLALIKRVESGESPMPEAMQTPKGWGLNIVAPIPSETAGDVEGVVWVVTKIDTLNPLLTQDNQGLGAVQLYQNFGERSRVLVKGVGEGALDAKHISPIADAAGAVSQWEVEFTASDALRMLTHINMGFVYLIIIAAIALSALLCALVGLVIGRAIDARKSHQVMLDTMTGKPVHSEGKDELTDTLYQSKDLFDVIIDKNDESLLGLEDDEEDAPTAEDDFSLDDDVFDIEDARDDGGSERFPHEVFRAYDIRGLAKEQINKEFAIALGQAFGSEVLMQRENTVVVARDARTHSPELTEWLIRGLLSTGCNVLNIGTVPTPLMYFALETMDEVSSGIMVTASHNDAPFNGFKIVLGGVARSSDDIKGLRQRMIEQQFQQGQGQEHHHDIVPTYIDTIFSDVALAGEMSVVIDAANGVAGKVAPQLFEELGCRVTPLYCDLDGTFPNHSPDPSREENLQDLIAKVKEVEADLGIALDGDGDRLTVVTPSGNIVWADKLLMLFAKDIISRSPGADVVFDVKSTRHLNACITGYGGRPIMWKTGHSLMKQKMMETGAVVGAEFSGHIFIKDRWFGFDDGMYAAARLLEILSLQGEDIDTAFEEFPSSVSTSEIRVSVVESEKFAIVEKLKADGDFGDGLHTLLDGLRVDFAYGWGLIRPSNTGAELTMRFEADDEETLHQIKSLFVRELRSIDSSIQIDWNQ